MAIEKSEKDKKAEAKVLDADDEAFCAFVKLHIVDRDGLGKVTKGSNFESNMFCEHTSDGKVKLTATWSPNPLYYLQLQSDKDLFFFGNMWYGEAKKNATNSIGAILPVSCHTLSEECEKNMSGKQSTCEVKIEIPFLKNAPKRQQTMTLTTHEERFETKVVGVEMILSREDWMEWKQYRLNFWTASKAWGGSGGEDEKKDEDKDKDKEKKEE